MPLYRGRGTRGPKCAASPDLIHPQGVSLVTRELRIVRGQSPDRPASPRRPGHPAVLGQRNFGVESSEPGGDVGDGHGPARRRARPRRAGERGDVARRSFRRPHFSSPHRRPHHVVQPVLPKRSRAASSAEARSVSVSGCAGRRPVLLLALFQPPPGASPAEQLEQTRIDRLLGRRAGARSVPTAELGGSPLPSQPFAPHLSSIPFLLPGRSSWGSAGGSHRGKGIWRQPSPAVSPSP